MNGINVLLGKSQKQATTFNSFVPFWSVVVNVREIIQIFIIFCHDEENPELSKFYYLTLLVSATQHHLPYQAPP